MQTAVTSSPDTTSTLSITTLAPTPSTTRAFRLEQPSGGRTMIPQAKDNKSLTQIRTQQVDELGYLLERGSHPPRYKQRETDNSGTPPKLLLAHTLAYTLQDSSKVDSPLLLLLSKVCCVVRSEGVPFYSPRRLVSARIKYGNVDNRHKEDKSESLAKMHLDGCTSRFGQTWGSDGPTLLILVPSFVLDTAWWSPILSMSVMGLCTSVFSVKWALLVSVTQGWIFYASCVCFHRISRMGACKSQFTKTCGIG